MLFLLFSPKPLGKWQKRNLIRGAFWSFQNQDRSSFLTRTNHFCPNIWVLSLSYNFSSYLQLFPFKSHGCAVIYREQFYCTIISQELTSPFCLERRIFLSTSLIFNPRRLEIYLFLFFNRFQFIQKREETLHLTVYLIFIFS